MKLLFRTHIENAVEALHSNRLRTILTVTGVTIGIASIAAILSLASGATQLLTQQAGAADESIALVRSGTDTTSLESMFTENHTVQAAATLTEKDTADLSALDSIKVAPMAILHATLSPSDESDGAHKAAIVGSSAELMSIAELELFEGQFLTDINGTNGMVMGRQLAIDLFGTEYALGNIVTVRGQTFTVIGVLKSVSQPINYYGVNFDDTALVQLDALKKFTQNVAQIQQIVLASANGQHINQTIKNADEVLSRNHHNEDDYAIVTTDEIMRPNSQLFSGVVMLVAVIAGISILVGGIGIMNIMLVNVAERRREIGIRKTIGATDGHIINQFLIESAIIGFLGGIAGYLIGIASAFLIGIYLPFMPALDWEIAALSVAIAVGTGILFGIYPAVRAAKRDPIESLH